jgi:beta-lactamase class C
MRSPAFLLLGAAFALSAHAGFASGPAMSAQSPAQASTHASTEAASPAIDEGAVERLLSEKLVPALIDDGIGGIAAAVRIGGRTLFLIHGFADMASRRPVSPDTLFNIASVRKVLEAIVLAKAVQAGELSFDDPVAKYVTELQGGGAITRVTLGQLARHTSGLLLPTDHPPWPDRGYTLSGFLDWLKAWTPRPGHAPGEAHEYTHAGYVLLQLGLERRYDRPIGELIGDAVLKPLGMTATVLPQHPLDGEHAALPGGVQGYDQDGAPVGVPGNQQSYYEFPGTGQMFSSPRDLARLLAACMGEGDAGPTLRAAIELTERPVFRIAPRAQQALAWEVNDFGGPPIVDKPGGIDNASAYLGFAPQAHTGIVILVNRGARNPHEVARNVILPELAKLSERGR